jgi:hypothetical protein
MSRLLAGRDLRNPRVVPDYSNWQTSGMTDVLGVSGQTLVAGSANVKGAYAFFVASTSAPSSMIWLHVYNVATSGANTATLVDLATGSVGNEVVFAANINAGHQAGFPGGFDIKIPYYIPAGVRVSGRCQSAVGSKNVASWIGLYSGPNRTAVGIDTIGATTATSTGTTVVCGTSGAEGSWTELTAATTNHYGGLMFSFGGAATATMVSTSVRVDIGMGAAASEVVLLNDWIANLDTSEAISLYDDMTPRIGVDIPAGTRLVARALSSSASAQSVDVTAYGLY